MSRTVCVQPCSFLGLPTYHVPMMGGGEMQAYGTFGLSDSCNGCTEIGNLFTQMSPVVGALGIPLCTLKCLGSLIKLTQSIIDALGPPPDPTQPIQHLADVLEKCKCVFEFVLPPPAGAICSYLKFIGSVLHAIEKVLFCVIGLTQDLGKLKLRAAVKFADPEPSVADVGKCALAQVQGLMDVLNGKFKAVDTFFGLVQPIIDLLATVTPPPFSTLMQDLSDGFILFSTSTPAGTPPEVYSQKLVEFQQALSAVLTGYDAVVGVCP